MRRTLLTMKAYIEAMRALLYDTAARLDAAEQDPVPSRRDRAAATGRLLTPVSKAWSTDLGVELTSLGIQVHGGMGYVEETGAAQLWRDSRIAPIYEGTNGIQGIDLVLRKLPQDGGAVVRGYLDEIAIVADEALSKGRDMTVIGENLATAHSVLAGATEWLLAAPEVADCLAGASPYLTMFGTVAGGRYLAKSALAARQLLEDGSSDNLLGDKIATATFYMRQLLPASGGFAARGDCRGSRSRCRPSEGSRSPVNEDLSPPAAAFFDLDRTIISGSSVFTFGYVAYTHGMLPRGELLRDLVSAVAFKFTGASDEKSEAVKNRILDSITGTRVEDLRHLGGEIIPRLLDGVRREARGLIDLHHDAGRDTYIVSASPIEIITDFAAAVGMTGALGTVAEVVDGTYTGELAEPFCYGEGKAIAIRKLAAEKEYDLALCYAYSDSGSDLPMLETVGHPVAVNPDSALETVAYHRGWPIVEFSRTRKRVITRTSAAAGAAGVALATYLLGRHHGRASAPSRAFRLRS